MRKWRLLAMCMLAAAAAGAAPAGGGDVDVDGMSNQLASNMQRSFALPPALPLDPALREQADAMAAAHLARIKALYPDWIREEHTLQSAKGQKPHPQAVFYAVWARALNELALWQITPGDAAYEQATLAAVTGAPLACRYDGDPRASDYAVRIMRVQAMPPALRQGALASERSLLARWGQPHADVAPYPDPLPQVAGMAAIAAMRTGAAPLPPALPPALASSMLAARGSYEQEPWESKCLFQQWWLRVSLARGMAPAVALSAFRYGTMITAQDRLGDWFDGQAPDQAAARTGRPTGYPAMATRFLVTGVTTIVRSSDAAGKPIDARVSMRKIAVPGIRGVRPVAFENAFDAVARTAAMQPPAVAGMPAQPVYNMVWSFDAPAPAAAKGTTP